MNNHNHDSLYLDHDNLQSSVNDPNHEFVVNDPNHDILWLDWDNLQSIVNGGIMTDHEHLQYTVKYHNVYRIWLKLVIDYTIYSIMSTISYQKNIAVVHDCSQIQITNVFYHNAHNLLHAEKSGLLVEIDLLTLQALSMNTTSNLGRLFMQSLYHILTEYLILTPTKCSSL